MLSRSSFPSSRAFWEALSSIFCRSFEASQSRRKPGIIRLSRLPSAGLSKTDLDIRPFGIDQVPCKPPQEEQGRCRRRPESAKPERQRMELLPTRPPILDVVSVFLLDPVPRRSQSHFAAGGVQLDEDRLGQWIREKRVELGPNLLVAQKPARPLESLGAVDQRPEDPNHSDARKGAGRIVAGNLHGHGLRRGRRFCFTG